MNPNLLLATNLNIGIQMEWTPTNSWNEFVASESLVHPLSYPRSGFTPWFTLQQDRWRLRSSLSPKSLQFNSRTATNQETYTLGAIHGALAVDRLYTQNNIEWNIGVGIGYTHPLWSLTSDALTDEEQIAVNAQNSIINAQIRGLDIHLPFSISTPITETLELGIGITYHWMMHYTTSDTERQLTHNVYPMPSIYLRL